MESSVPDDFDAPPGDSMFEVASPTTLQTPKVERPRSASNQQSPKSPPGRPSTSQSDTPKKNKESQKSPKKEKEEEKEKKEEKKEEKKGKEEKKEMEAAKSTEKEKKVTLQEEKVMNKKEKNAEGSSDTAVKHKSVSQMEAGELDEYIAQQEAKLKEQETQKKIEAEENKRWAVENARREEIVMLSERERDARSRHTEGYDSQMSRLENVRQTCSEVLKFVKDRASAESLYAKSFLGSKKKDAAPSENMMRESGIFRDAWLQFYQASTAMRSEVHTEFSRVLTQEIGGHMNSLVNEVTKVSKKIKSEGDSLTKLVDGSRTKLEKLWDSYQTKYKEADEKKKLKKQVKTDPFLLELQFREAQNEHIANQKKYYEGMAKLMDDLEGMDIQRLEGLKNVFGEYVMENKKLLYHIQQSVDESAKCIELIQVEVDRRKAQEQERQKAQQERVASEWVWPSQTSMSNPFQTSVQVLRQGTLFRRGTVTRKWKECYVVITRAGYLHIFNAIEDHTPWDSMKLDGASLTLVHSLNSNMDENLVFEVAYSAFFENKSYKFKAPAEDLMVDWMMTVRQFATYKQMK